MLDDIVDAPNPKTCKMIKWVRNPVNESENFADKWSDYPQRQENFYKWHAQLKKDIYDIFGKRNGLHNIQEAMTNPFGKDIITKTFSSYAEKTHMLTEDGKVKMASGTGFLGAIGTAIKAHNFHGNK